ncbi:DNA methyltransferase [Actinomycetaceae bacterium MB13-C1-2]|nr:DNA methyltransferase [Actinomycetaceae bacterium MB13-C1-2]
MKHPEQPLNELFYGDNLDVLRTLPSESVDLIYLDPPFNSNRNYSVIFNRHGTKNADVSAQIQAFEDTWRWTQKTEQDYLEFIATAPNEAANALTAFRTLLGENDASAYLVNMAPRLVELHRVLKDTGSLYLHCDPTMSHYLKILLDAIFDPRNYINEIIWAYKSGGASKKHFARKHDVILFYAKDYRNKFFDIQKEKSYNRDYKPYRFKGIKEYEDDRGWYTLVNMRDVWNIPMVGRTSAERLGYPTQKPLALLERIIEASTNPDDVVLDPFCGCGTTIDAAEKLGRHWIGIDITYIAVDLIVKRLEHTYGAGIRDTFEVLGMPKDLAGAQALFDRDPFEFERWAVSHIGAQPNERQVGDRGIDGVSLFPLDTKGRKLGKVLVSVKGGKTVTPSMVRDLAGTVEHTTDAHLGVLVTMGPLTRGSQEAIDRSGSYSFPVNGQPYPRLQHISVPEILQGMRPYLPPTYLPYIEAKRQKVQVDAGSLF